MYFYLHCVVYDLHCICGVLSFFFECYGVHLDLQVLTHSCPTRRSSDLLRSLGRDWRGYALKHPPREDNEHDKTLGVNRSEEHTSELQSLMRRSYAGFCLKKKK